MLAYMTKEDFKRAIDEYRFVVRMETNTKWEVLHMSQSERNKFGIQKVIKPNKVDHYFRQTGGGYNKAMACIEDIAQYVDEHSPEGSDFSCYDYFMARQHYNVI